MACIRNSSANKPEFVNDIHLNIIPKEGCGISSAAAANAKRDLYIAAKVMNDTA